MFWNFKLHVVKEIRLDDYGMFVSIRTCRPWTMLTLVLLLINKDKIIEIYN